MARYQQSKVREILLGKKAIDVVIFPGTENLPEPVKVGIRCLGESEIDECRARAQQLVRRKAKDLGVDPESFHDFDPEYFERIVHRQILVKALIDEETKDSDNPAPFFSNDSDVTELSAAQTNQLMEVYLEHQNRVSPFLQLSKERVEELVDAMGKPSWNEDTLSAYGRETLIVLCVSMASLLRERSPTGKSPTG